MLGFSVFLHASPIDLIQLSPRSSTEARFVDQMMHPSFEVPWLKAQKTTCLVLGSKITYLNKNSIQSYCASYVRFLMLVA